MIALQIDIISDTVCPWCYIGKKRMEQALANINDIAISVMWRPYQLNPDMPAEGMDRKAYMKAKFGSSGAGKDNPAYQAITEAGKDAGIAFDFHAIEKMPNTLDSHRLVRWAESAGCQDAVVSELFARYFEKGEDVSDHAVLIDVAQGAGMDPEIVKDLLEKDADKDLIAKEDRFAREMGVQGVPSFLVNQQFVLTGAQDADTIERLLRRAHEVLTKKAAEAEAAQS